MYNPREMFNSLSLVQKVYTVIERIDKSIRDKLVVDGLKYISEGDPWKGNQKTNFIYYGHYISYKHKNTIYYGFYFDILDKPKLIDTNFVFSVGLKETIIPPSRKKMLTKIAIKEKTKEYDTNNELVRYVEGEKNTDKWYYFPVNRKIITKDDFGEDLKNEVVTIIENNLL